MSITITVGLLLSSLGGLEIEMVDVDPRTAPVRAPVVIEEPSPEIVAESPIAVAPNPADQVIPCPGNPHHHLASIGELVVEEEVDSPAGPSRFQILDQKHRPDWVGQAPQVKGEGDHWIAVSSDPWKSSPEAEEGLVKKIRKAVNDYVDEQIGRAGAARAVRLNQADLNRLLGPAQKYREELLFGDSAIGVMQQHHAQIVFTPEFRADIRQRWRDHVVSSRLLRTGGTVVAVLVGLIVAFGVLKSATR